MGVVLLAALRIGLLYLRVRDSIHLKKKKIIEAEEKQHVHTQRAETVG